MSIPPPTQHWPLPERPRPIVAIGAGGIMRDAHLPAYVRAGFPVAAVVDPDLRNARALAETFGIETAMADLSPVTDRFGTDVIYDLATPPEAIAGILSQLPEGAGVQIQKPMGVDLTSASRIDALVRARDLTAAVNFQLRFAPMMLAAQDLIRKGVLGELLEIDVQVNIHTPWEMFPFLKSAERLEFSLHSIHYFDMIRALAGEPLGVFARTMSDPRNPDYAQTRSSAILDYGARLRVLVSCNHNHDYGNRHQQASFRIEGQNGALWIKMGVLYDYPNGEADEVWLTHGSQTWHQIPLSGTWFPDAFAGRMANLQRVMSGEDKTLISPVRDALRTMALIEALYEANASTGIAPEL